MVLAEDADLGTLVGQCPAQGVLSHEAHDEDGVPLVADAVDEVVENPAGLAHARGGNDDAGLAQVVELLGFGGVGEVAEGVEAEGTLPVVQELLHRLGVVAILVGSEDGGGRDGHGAVHENGQGGDAPRVVEAVQEVDQLLGALHGESRDNDAASPGHGAAHHLGQVLLGRGERVVETVAVGALADEVIHRGKDLRIPEEGEVGAPQISREAHDGPLVELEPDERRAEDVPRVEERGPDAARDLLRASVGEGHVTVQRVLDVLRVVEGREDAPARAGRPALLFLEETGVTRLDPCGIFEDEPGDVPGGGGREDAPAVAVPDQERVGSAVVQVAVRVHAGVDGGGLEGKGEVLAMGLLAVALEDPAVHKDPHVTRVEQVFAPRDLLRGSECCQRDAHEMSPRTG